MYWRMVRKEDTGKLGGDEQQEEPADKLAPGCGTKMKTVQPQCTSLASTPRR